MKSIKALLRQWLGVVFLAEYDVERVDDYQRIQKLRDEYRAALSDLRNEFQTQRAGIVTSLREEYRHVEATLQEQIADTCEAMRKLSARTQREKAEREAAITELIQELNALRNSNPPAAQDPQRPVRIYRNFREFRTVIEHQPVERKS